jgi:hypothetical protein
MASVAQMISIIDTFYKKHQNNLINSQEFNDFMGNLDPESYAISLFVIGMEIKDMDLNSIANDENVNKLLLMVKDFNAIPENIVNQQTAFFITMAEIYLIQYYLFSDLSQYLEYFKKNKINEKEALATMEYSFFRMSTIYSLLLKSRSFISLGFYYSYLVNFETNYFYEMIRDVGPYQTGIVLLDSDFHYILMSFPKLFIDKFFKE